MGGNVKGDCSTVVSGGMQRYVVGGGNSVQNATSSVVELDAGTSWGGRRDTHSELRSHTTMGNPHIIFSSSRKAAVVLERVARGTATQVRVAKGGATQVKAPIKVRSIFSLRFSNLLWGGALVIVCSLVMVCVRCRGLRQAGSSCPATSVGARPRRPRARGCRRRQRAIAARLRHALWSLVVVGPCWALLSPVEPCGALLSLSRHSSHDGEKLPRCSSHDARTTMYHFSNNN